MAAHADQTSLRTGGFIARVKAFTDRLGLDRRLATGTSPDASPQLARRADVLRGWRVRHQLADSLEHVLMEALAPGRDNGAAVPVQRDAVLAAQRDVLRLVRALRSEPAAPVRAVATVSLLLTDGSGPLFVPYPQGTLGEVLFRAAFLAEEG
jgi:hypothetical protein